MTVHMVHPCPSSYSGLRLSYMKSWPEHLHTTAKSHVCYRNWSGKLPNSPAIIWSLDGASHCSLKKKLKLDQLVFVFPHFPEIIRKHTLHFIINLQGIFEVSGDGFSLSFMSTGHVIKKKSIFWLLHATVCQKSAILSWSMWTLPTVCQSSYPKSVPYSSAGINLW